MQEGRVQGEKHKLSDLQGFSPLPGAASWFAHRHSFPLLFLSVLPFHPVAAFASVIEMRGWIGQNQGGFGAFAWFLRAALSSEGKGPAVGFHQLV